MRGIISKLTDSVRGVSKDTGVSPVIGVVLLVVIVVAIGGVVGFFATELSNQNQETSQTEITVNESQSELVVEVVEPLDIRVNGQTINTIDTEAGARINHLIEISECRINKI